MVRKFLAILSLGCFALVIVGCKGIHNPFVRKDVLAKVDKKELRFRDVAHIFTPGIDPADSLKLLEAYVDTWVKNQLKINQAEKLLGSEKKEIDKMVEEYRNSLLSMKLDQYWFDNSGYVEGNFTQEQINEYYQKNKSEFVLNRAMVKGLGFSFPENSRLKGKLDALARTRGSEKMLDIIDICLKNNYPFREVKKWSDLTEVLANMPIVEEKKYSVSIKQMSYIEASDDNKIYYFVIEDSRAAGDASPLEVVEEVIKRAMFAATKQQVVKNNEDSMYRASVADGTVTVNFRPKSGGN